MELNKIRIPVLFFVILTVSGCSLQYRKAKKFLQNGEYIAAEQAYKNILEKSPKDPEALEGLHSARENIIDKRLLEIRYMRLAGNHDEALSAFRDLFKDEADWDLYPRGAVFFTQQEELKYALSHVTQIVDTRLAEKHPVLARQYFDGYKDIFWQGKTLDSAKSLDKKIIDSGNVSCLDFVGNVSDKTPYFAGFVRRYCSYWGSPTTSSTTISNRTAETELYGVVSLKLDSEDLPDEIKAEWNSGFQAVLENSPFYGPGVKHELPVQLTARFKDLRNEVPVSLTQEYTTQEPYTAYVPVLKTKQVPYNTTELQMKWRSVPYSTTKYEYNYYTGRYESVPVTEYRNDSYLESVPVVKYRTEFYTETEAVTKYKTVPHAYSYAGTVYRQNLILLAEGAANVGKKKLPLVVNKQETNKGVSHHENIPDIGLTPKLIHYLNPVDWIKTNSRELSPMLQEKLDALWSELYCHSPQTGDSVGQSGELVYKCARSEKGRALEFVNQWSIANLGLPYEEASNLFKD